MSPEQPLALWAEERGQLSDDKQLLSAACPVAACSLLSHTTWCLMTTLSAKTQRQHRGLSGPIRGKIETLLFLNSLKQHKR